MPDSDGGYAGPSASDVIEFRDKDGKKTVAVMDRTEGKVAYYIKEDDSVVVPTKAGGDELG